MIDVGRVCVKIAGRDAGKKCVVIEVVDDRFVIVDGGVRRKRCNTLHLEPLAQVLDIRQGASHDEVVAALREAGITVPEARKRAASRKPAIDATQAKAGTEKKARAPVSPKKAAKVRK